MEKSLIPRVVKIKNVEKETYNIKSIWIKKMNKEYHPGQFVTITVFGCGEVPLSLIQYKNEWIITFRKVGKVTSKLFFLKKGDFIGIRGPFGKGFPYEKWKGKNILLLAGGIGLPPIAALIWKIVEKRRNYRKVILCYGAKTPKDLVFKRWYRKWKNNDIEVYLTVDNPTRGWKENIGFVTDLIDKIQLDKKWIVCMCGPSTMMKFASKKLIDRGIKKKNIFISLERLMQCGLGMCGHCNINGFYVCLDGPVFKLSEIEKSVEKIW